MFAARDPSSLQDRRVGESREQQERDADAWLRSLRLVHINIASGEIGDQVL